MQNFRYGSYVEFLFNSDATTGQLTSNTSVYIMEHDFLSTIGVGPETVKHLGNGND